MKSLLCDDALNLNPRQLVKCYVSSTLLNGVEFWTLKQATIERLETLEMWLHSELDIIINTHANTYFENYYIYISTKCSRFVHPFNHTCDYISICYMKNIINFWQSFITNLTKICILTHQTQYFNYFRSSLWTK